MAVDPSRFVTEEQSFSGLHKAADTLDRNRQRQEALDYKREGKKAAASTFLNSYLDQKDFLTGTNYDPEIVKQLQETMYEGAKLASEGADTPTIMMALSPKVSRLSEYSTKAKLVNQRLKDQMSQIKPGMGYDLKSLENQARRLAFYGEGDKLKDISTVDPETDWLTETIKLYPERVTTDAGIDEFVKNSPKFTNTKDISKYNAQRGMTRSKVKITSPNWLVPDTDERGAVTGLVPKYQVALNDGQPLMHDFQDEQGKTVKAPVRLLDEQEFKSLMSSNPGVADWVRGQVKQAGGNNLDLNSPQANNLARAILYDELKRRSPGSIEDIEVQKANPAPIVHVSVGGTKVNPYQGMDGNEFDRIDKSKFMPKITSKVKSAFEMPEMKAEPNVFRMKASDLPGGTFAILKGGGLDVSDAEEFEVGVDDQGRIDWIAPDGGKKIYRNDMENAQLKYNTEPAKGQQLQYGKKPVTRPATTTTKKNDPLGLFP
jgi:hypothetical protein